MLFNIGSSVVQAYEATQGFFFVIDGVVIIPDFDDESCFVVINGARLNVTHL